MTIRDDRHCEVRSNPDITILLSWRVVQQPQETNYSNDV